MRNKPIILLDEYEKETNEIPEIEEEDTIYCYE